MGEGYVTRTELNGSIVRLEEQVRELRGETGEIYKVLREQNSCFLSLLDREIDKREDCARDHDTSQKALETAINDHAQGETRDKVTFTRKLFYIALGALGSFGLATLMFVLGYVTRR